MGTGGSRPPKSTGWPRGRVWVGFGAATGCLARGATAGRAGTTRSPRPSLDQPLAASQGGPLGGSGQCLPSRQATGTDATLPDPEGLIGAHISIPRGVALGLGLLLFELEVGMGTVPV